MPNNYAGFVDVGFLKKEGAKALGVNPHGRQLRADAVVSWLTEQFSGSAAGPEFLRAYWYDGAFASHHPEYLKQHRYFEAIGLTPGIQLRLGNIAEQEPPYAAGIRRAVRQTATDIGLDPDTLLAAFNKRWQFRPQRQQKGVDTLIALDLVRLAGRGVVSTAVLVSGDRDLAEAIRAAQDFGTKVLVTTPRNKSVARPVAKLADGIINLSKEDLNHILPPRDR